MTEAPIPPAAKRATLTLKVGAHRRPMTGHPWVYSNEIEMTAAAKALAPGSIVRLCAHDGRPLGTVMFNPRPLISARFLSREPDLTVDRAWLVRRLEGARALRDLLYGAPYYRLVHAEADGLPGLVIDRFGPAVVVQLNTAGMDRLSDELVAALVEVTGAETVVLRNDSSARALEGLEQSMRLAKGSLDGPVTVEENGARFFADLREGQKTGWFYDQRDNRAAVTRLAGGARVLDLYCFSGGFAVPAAMAGATVLAVDRSAPALDLATMAAAANGVAGRCEFRRAEVFEELETLAAAGERFDIVIADPPAFVKLRKDLPQGQRAYRKLARLTAALVRPGGFLFLASCSYNMAADDFAQQTARGLNDARREGRILRNAGAGADHPVHPALPESAYLKSVLLQLD
jgi:23S rRNA (cytosine1962-C5)-methyltransferase